VGGPSDFSPFSWVLAAISKRFGLFLGLIGVGLALLFVYLAFAPRKFEAVATLLVEPHDQRVLPGQPLVPDSLTPDLVLTTSELMKSKDVVLPVVKRFHLTPNPKEDPMRLWGLLSGEYGDDQVAAKFARRIKVKPRNITRLIDVSVTFKDPKMASELANAYVEEFLKQSLTSKVKVAVDAHEALAVEADKLRLKSEASREALRKYEEENGTVSLIRDENIMVDKLKDINSAATAATKRKIALESDLEALRKVDPSDTEGMLRVESVSNLPDVASLRRQIVATQTELSQMEGHYLELNPKRIAVANKLKNLNDSLSTVLKRASVMLQQEYNAQVSSEVKLAKALSDQEKNSFELGHLSVPYQSLKQHADTDETLYKSVVARMKEAGVAGNVVSIPYHVVSFAIVPTKPSTPKVAKTLIVGTFLIFALACLVVLVFEATSGSFRRVDEVESALDLPVLVSIPGKTGAWFSSVGKKGERGSYPLVMVDTPNSLVAEAFRTLRVSVGMALRGKDGKSVLFTSSVPGEGKSFTALNYAVALATSSDVSRGKVLLVDADLRVPTLGGVFLGGNDKVGLSDYILGDAGLKEAAHATLVPGLDVMPAGSVKNVDASSLLGTKGLKAALSTLHKEYKWVIIDTPPVGAVSDAYWLFPLVKHVVFVVRSDSTPVAVVKRCLTKMVRAGAKVMGVAFNGVSPRPYAAAHYYHQYAYGAVKPSTSSPNTPPPSPAA
jgi:capsular exopolysaccharide synthesis family protein